MPEVQPQSGSSKNNASLIDPIIVTPPKPDPPPEPAVAAPPGAITMENGRVMLNINPEPVNDLSLSYMERRDNTPSDETLAIMSEQQQNQQAFSEAMKRQGVPEEETQAEVRGGNTEPWIDPITVFAGAGGATAMLTKSVGKGLLSGAIGATAEYPIGTATDLMPEKYQLPANLAFGLISGVTLESAAEKAIVKALESNGVKVTQKVISEHYARILEDIKSGEFQRLAGKVINNEAGSVPVGQDLQETITRNLVDTLKTESSTSTAALVAQKKRPLFEVRSEMATEDKAQAFFDMPNAIDQRSFPGRDIPDKAININFSRIDTEDDIKEVIFKTSELYKTEINEARRNVITNGALGQLADDLGFPLDTLLQRKQGQAFNAETALASRKILVASADNLRGLAQKASGLEASDLDKFAFRRALNTHYAIQSQVSGMTAEAGRALQQFRIGVESEEALVGQIKSSLESLRSMERGGATEQLASMILTLDSAGQVTKFTRDIRKASTMDMIREYWINAILSGPVTHAVNMTSNALVAITQPVERVTGAVFGRFFQALGQGEAEIKMGEAVGQVLGIKQGFEDGFKFVGELSRIATDESLGDAWKHLANVISTPMATGKMEYRPAINGTNLNLSGNIGRAADLLGEVVRLPGTALQAEDAVFKGIGYRMELWAQAYRTAAAEGLSGQGLSSRIVDLVNNPSATIQKAASDAADYQTFTSRLGDTGRYLQGLLSSHPIFTFIVPFLKTPTNVFKYFGERTPLALLSKTIREDIGSGGALRDMALAKITLGSTIMSLAGMWAYDGTITGAGPKEPELQQAWRRTGWQPYSFKIGGSYFSYGRLEPLGTLLGVAATVGEIVKEYDIGNIEDVDHLYAAGAIALSRNVADKTFLQGVSKFINAYHNPGTYQTNYIRDFATSFEPNVLAQVTQREVDPVVREVNSLIDAFKAKTPLLSDTLFPKRNIWGEPLTRENMPMVPDVVSPILASTDKKSKIDNELKKLNIGFDLPKKMLQGVEMIPAERDRLIQLVGNEWKDPSNGMGLKEFLTDFIQSDDYKRQSKEGKIKAINHIYDQYKKAATDQLLQEFPDLAANVEKRKNRKQEELQSVY
jgi:hypothetical protein